MRDFLEIQFFRLVKWVIYRGYGWCDHPRELCDGKLDRGCAACKASEVQDWIDGHISLLEWNKKSK